MTVFIVWLYTSNQHTQSMSAYKEKQCTCNGVGKKLTR